MCPRPISFGVLPLGHRISRLLLKPQVADVSNTMWMTTRHFNKGDKVEVSKNDAISNYFNSVWFPAIILRSSSANHKDQIFVEFETLIFNDKSWKPLKEYANGVNDEIEVEQRNLRIHRDGDDGAWVPPLYNQSVLENQKKSPELEVKPGLVKVRIKYSGRASDAKFSKGTMVEVNSDKEGYRGSWYTAVIVGLVGNNKLLVEYQMLKRNDGSELLTEEVDVSCVRPCPPGIQQLDRYEQHEQVDAWYNSGWWVGHIAKILNELKYRVIFGTLKEESVFEHCRLRPHQEWIEGRWVAASKSQEFKIKIKCCGRKSEPNFNKGMPVEVKSDEEGYQGSWYTAVTMGSIGIDKFLVEYQTLKTDDESELLKEKADASYMRPCPPEIVRVNRFQMLENVDAWYNDGWWMGLISKVLDGLKYAVYFWTTKEELVFEHANLRPHQEWIDGKWVLAVREHNVVWVSLFGVGRDDHSMKQK
ncbi:unnamed protein product [Ilex paraguariensis]|uniref:Agenet domain-containing protein n=1 Tax=Ilex paraguariensis TaxID=185542 RepID=A0ABC8RLV5_9AQUA